VFYEIIKNCNVFFDIGANIGYYSVLAAKENQAIRVFAFEPAIGPLHYLQKNIRLNNLDNVRIESIALSDREGSLTFYEQGNRKYPYLKYNLSGENNAGTKTDSSKYSSREVPSMTLDKYVEENNIQQIDLMKLDTEGTEYSILKHAAKTLSTFKPTVICETLFNSNEEELEEIFLSHHYRMYKLKGATIIPVDTLKREEDDGIRDCIFIHPDRESSLKSIFK
jgi:FkbM family methyltransferase